MKIEYQACWQLSRALGIWQTFGEKACHPERSEGSGSTDAEILRCAQDDRQDTAHGKPSLQMSTRVFCLLTKRKYVYILLIMKEQRNQEVNMAKVLEADLSDVVSLVCDL